MSKEKQIIDKTNNEIEQLLDRISINESYAFEEDLPSKSQSSEISPERKNISPNYGIDEKIKQIRKISINLLSELNPSNDSESYKMIKGIWDSCDKYLTRNVSNNTESQKNNNI
jgi:hypothetical protein